MRWLVTAVGQEAWTLYGHAGEAGLGKLDTSGLLGLLEPKPLRATCLL